MINPTLGTEAEGAEAEPREVQGHMGSKWQVAEVKSGSICPRVELTPFFQDHTLKTWIPGRELRLKHLSGN